MIPRTIQKELQQSANEYPVVTLIGPRQAGKTTLARTTFPQYGYCNLENPDLRRLAQDDPNALFAKFSGPTVFDEIQRVPEILSYIQVRVDEDPRKGLYILTGSHQLKLHQSITQSLAGRTAVLKLMPLSMEELNHYGISQNWHQFLLNGFLPRIHNDNLNPTRAYRNYYETYVERDVRELIHLKELSSFEKFLRLLAGRCGQVINLSSLANDVGVSSNTLKSWLSVLEASFIIFKLQPYFENFGKRVIKSPKIYFTDTGLLCYLLGIENLNQLERDPLIGNLFENLVVTEAIKSRYNQGLDHHLFYYRTTKGEEVDLLYQQGRDLVPIEIKSSMTFHRRFTKGVEHFQNIARNATNGYVIYTGEMEHQSDHYALINYLNVAKLF